MDTISYVMGKKAGGGSGGTSNYDDLSNKPSINNVELNGNKTTSDLGLFSGDYDDLTNKPTIPDISGKQDKIDSNNKLDADLVDDTNSTNKFFSGSYNDLSNKPIIPDIVQYLTIPTASVDNLGKIIQYTGTTDANYTNGYFYKCVSDGQDPATYSWENIEIQESSGSSTVTLIEEDVYIADLPIGMYYVKNGVKLKFGTYNNDAFGITIASNNFNSYSILHITHYATINNIDYVYYYFQGISAQLTYQSYSSSIGGDGGLAIINGRCLKDKTAYPQIIANTVDSKVGTNIVYYNNASGSFLMTKSIFQTVIANKQMALKELSTYDATKTQVLKNINGTLTWVDEA